MISSVNNTNPSFGTLLRYDVSNLTPNAKKAAWNVLADFFVKNICDSEKIAVGINSAKDNNMLFQITKLNEEPTESFYYSYKMGKKVKASKINETAQKLIENLKSTLDEVYKI